MKRDYFSIRLVFLLALGCVIYRLLGALWPDAIPNASPLMALSLVAGIYFSPRWGWLVGPAVCVVTELALIPLNKHVLGVAVPYWDLVALPVYFAAGGLGLFIASRKSLGKIVAGSVALSLLFYVGENTFCWLGSGLAHSTPGYALSFAGWWQANTTGIPGYPPTWMFLRNGVLGDLFFLSVFLLILDRAIFFWPAGTKAVARPA